MPLLPWLHGRSHLQGSSEKLKGRIMSTTDITKTAIANTALDHFRKGDALIGADSDQRLQLGYEVIDESPLTMTVRVRPPGLNGPRYFTIKVSENI